MSKNPPTPTQETPPTGASNNKHPEPTTNTREEPASAEATTAGADTTVTEGRPGNPSIAERPIGPNNKRCIKDEKGEKCIYGKNCYFAHRNPINVRKDAAPRQHHELCLRSTLTKHAELVAKQDTSHTSARNSEHTAMRLSKLLDGKVTTSGSKTKIIVPSAWHCSKCIHNGSQQRCIIQSRRMHTSRQRCRKGDSRLRSGRTS